MIIPEEWRKNEMKKLVVDDKVYYVSDKLATLIEKMLKSQKCKRVKIYPLDEGVRKI